MKVEIDGKEFIEKSDSNSGHRNSGDWNSGDSDVFILWWILLKEKKRRRAWN